MMIYNPLVGDSGYAETAGQQRYNESHIRTRNTIERLFGVLKRRFPILAYGCRLKLETFLTIIVTTAVLHNVALDVGDNLAPEELDNHILNQLIETGEIPNINNDAQDDVAAVSRAHLINNFFELLH
ncbi:DDE superfamily endonuclease [Popillia japonica]|uniref:DDE superfamily endonuclease n=1 Tax=Popillia japonica TaxID=7064 RepID=A0AAW1I7N7_POPJA